VIGSISESAIYTNTRNTSLLFLKGILFMKNIVIVGGGYAGYKIITQLIEKGIPENYQVTLIDRHAYHSLKTEFYALASGSISDFHVRMPFPDHQQFTLLNGEILSIDINEKKIDVRELEESVGYDHLVIALGCEDNYQGIEGAEEFTRSLQSLAKTRRTYESINNLDPDSVVSLIGGGLTGVELAAELREVRHDLSIRIYDRGEKLLKGFPDKLRTFVMEWFVDHGIEIRSNSTIEKIEENTIVVNGTREHADAIVWTAGVQPVKVVRDLDVEKDKSGRIIINDYYQINEHPEVLVVGDCASLPFAPSAQLAGKQGEQVAKMLDEMMNEKEIQKPGEINLKGTLGSLGKKNGFGVVYNNPVTGSVPRLMKSGTLWAHKLYKY
jgi:NADH:ubiquinone reductase (H+-translocating)